MENNKKYAPSMILNLTRNGKGSTVRVNAKVFDMLQRVKLGDALYLQELSPESVQRIKSKLSFDSTPTHELVVLSGDQNVNTAKPVVVRSKSPLPVPNSLDDI